MAIPLSLLHTFVIVARAGRMRDAAAVLSLTPGAISQRIRELEEIVGHRLFARTSTGVVLEAAGEAMFSRLDASFRVVEEVSGEIDASASRRIRVTTVAAFAADWLVPRLAEFSCLHPEVDVEVETESRLVDLLREPVDVAIRHGLGDYPGLETVWLMAPELIVVASPDLLRSRRPIASPADCLTFPLLHDRERADWRLWFEAQGIAVSSELKGPSFDADHLSIRAAVAGQGLALVRDVHAGEELRAGRLVKAIDVIWPTRFAYYAVSSARALQRPAVRHFRDWLRRETASLRWEGSRTVPMGEEKTPAIG